MYKNDALFFKGLDDLQNVENIINQAANELQQVTEEVAQAGDPLGSLRNALEVSN